MTILEVHAILYSTGILILLVHVHTIVSWIQAVGMVMSGWLVISIMGEWNSVMEECGGQFVTIDGMTGKQRWCVDS